MDNPNYQIFTEQINRDRYLDLLIANGYQVKPEDHGEKLFTVVDIDRRKGK